MSGLPLRGKPIKSGRLYLKVFLSFMVALIATLFLVFGFFRLFIVGKIETRLEQFTGVQAAIVK
ncbi:MAG: hypothetical protein JRC92_11525, partial [Deltaproteobacteria bacterium]|nr:hypothetical protein [Deltaproteobacteria bacterium]